MTTNFIVFLYIFIGTCSEKQIHVCINQVSIMIIINNHINIVNFMNLNTRK